jgi:hypothetical protein
MRPGNTIDYTVKAIRLEGTFSVREERDPTTGQVLSVFALTDAVVIPPKSRFGE